MSVQILMPALSPTMTEGNLTRWLKAEGDTVAPGDVLAEIETDKATMEVEAVDEGVLGKILVPEGAEDVAVNTPIAVLLEDGDGTLLRYSVKADVGGRIAQVGSRLIESTANRYSRDFFSRFGDIVTGAVPLPEAGEERPEGKVSGRLRIAMKPQ